MEEKTRELVTNFDILLKLRQSSFANIVFNVAKYECKTLEEFENFLSKEMSEENKKALWGGIQMKNTTKELAVQALNDLLVAMSQNAGAQPCCSEEFASKSEYIRSLSTAIMAVHPVALSVNLNDLLGQ